MNPREVYKAEKKRKIIPIKAQRVLEGCIDDVINCSDLNPVQRERVEREMYAAVVTISLGHDGGGDYLSTGALARGLREIAQEPFGTPLVFYLGKEKSYRTKMGVELDQALKGLVIVLEGVATPKNKSKEKTY